MTVTSSWTDPGAGGTLDLANGSLVTETHWDALVSNLLYIGGSTGNIKNAGGWQVVAGGLSVGGTVPAANIGVLVGGTLAGGTTQYGVQSLASASGVTGAYTAVYARPDLTGATTTPSRYGLYAANAQKLSGATLTSDYGMFVEAISGGATNNYGVYISAPSGGSGDNYGLLNLGTSLLVGAVRIGALGSGYASTGAVRLSNTEAVVWRNGANNGDVVLGIDTSNRFVFSGGIAVSTTVGAAGGAAAPPATPVAYWIVNIGGTNYKVRLDNV